MQQGDFTDADYDTLLQLDRGTKANTGGTKREIEVNHRSTFTCMLTACRTLAGGEPRRAYCWESTSCGTCICCGAQLSLGIGAELQCLWSTHVPTVPHSHLMSMAGLHINHESPEGC